jgi:hypothetical protein
VEPIESGFDFFIGARVGARDLEAPSATAMRGVRTLSGGRSANEDRALEG